MVVEAGGFGLIGAADHRFQAPAIGAGDQLGQGLLGRPAGQVIKTDLRHGFTMAKPAEVRQLKFLWSSNSELYIHNYMAKNGFNISADVQQKIKAHTPLQGLRVRVFMETSFGHDAHTPMSIERFMKGSDAQVMVFEDRLAPVTPEDLKTLATSLPQGAFGFSIVSDEKSFLSRFLKPSQTPAYWIGEEIGASADGQKLLMTPRGHVIEITSRDMILPSPHTIEPKVRVASPDEYGITRVYRAPV